MMKVSSVRSENSNLNPNSKSSKETQLVLELRTRLKHSNLELEEEKLNKDSFLRRYLSETKWNVDKAEKLLHNYMKVNKEIDLDSLKDKKFPKEFGALYKSYIGGVDYENRPVSLVVSVDGDVSTLLARVNDEGIRKQFFEFSVQLNMLMEKLVLERNVENAVSIVDVSKIKYWQFLGKKVIDFQLNNFKRLQEHTPGLMGKVIIVNAPRIAKAILKLVQKLVTFSTQVVIYHSEEDWKEELRKHVPEEAVSPHFGGTRENCEEVVCNFT